MDSETLEAIMELRKEIEKIKLELVKLEEGLDTHTHEEE